MGLRRGRHRVLLLPLLLVFLQGILKQFKYALVWGSSAKHRPQRVGKEHILEDEDIVQIVKKV